MQYAAIHAFAESTDTVQCLCVHSWPHGAFRNLTRWRGCCCLQIVRAAGHAWAGGYEWGAPNLLHDNVKAYLVCACFPDQTPRGDHPHPLHVP
jgi:hypothetical protein